MGPGRPVVGTQSPPWSVKRVDERPISSDDAGFRLARQRTAYMTALVSSIRVTDPKPWVLRYLWPIVAAMLVLRLLTDMRFSLVPDEAVYWSWSRHPATGYFDHPPMIAWINWLSCHLIGSTELGVRLPMTFLGLGAAIFIIATARTIIPDAQGVALVAIMWLVSPLLMGIATISTPDTPAVFFSTCALACAARIALQDDEAQQSSASSAGLWTLFGVFCGLAFLSKYTTVLLPAGVVISLMLSTRGRRHLRQPWIYLAALVAAIVFSPNICWNYHHHWASFLFQFHHGLSDAPNEAPVGIFHLILLICRNLLLYLGGQALIWTPVLFVTGLVIMWKKTRRLLHINEVDRLLLISAALPLAFFAAASAHKLGEINWPMFAYVPLSLLTGRWVCEENKPARRHVVKEGCKLALIFTVVAHVLFLPGIPKLLILAHVPLPHSARDLLVEDRHRYGRELAAAADGALIVTNRHQDAAEAAFYMPGQPDVWCDGIGSRPTAFDYFDTKPDFFTISHVLFLGGHVGQFMAKYHYLQSRQVIVTPGPARGSNLRTAFMVSR
jgi:4-amino-4-deoxy-L-arabinose transferase-like glycosyltransferase